MIMAAHNWTQGLKQTKYQGIWKSPTGYRIRVRGTDPRTGEKREANQHLLGLTLDQAVVKQVEMRQQLLTSPQAESQREKFAAYAASLTERKIALGKLQSEASRVEWAGCLDLHLIPYFGNWYVEAISRRDIQKWLTLQAKDVESGKLSPHTVNNRLRILCNVMRQAVGDLELDKDPTLNIEPLDTSTRVTYSEEEPNSLTPKEVQMFLEELKKRASQHYAFMVLGFATGRRPSELRPLRRKGPQPDIKWADGLLLVRRSETKGVVMEKTKTGNKLRIPLPSDLVDILREHADSLPEGPMRSSDLLFPSAVGGFRSSTCLTKPMAAVLKATGITKHITPRAMRRTYQDLTRLAKVHDFVARAISGHETVEMHDHYSTVGGDEVRAGLAKVIGLVGIGRGYGGGYAGVFEGPKKENPSA